MLAALATWLAEVSVVADPRSREKERNKRDLAVEL